MAATKIVYYIIPLVVLVLMVMWQYGPDGLFDDLKGSVKGILNVSVGSEKMIAGKPTSPGNEAEAIKNLVDTIKQMAKTKDTNCFLNYGGLPELQGSSLTLQLKGDKLAVVVGGGAGGKQEVSYEEISGIKPCVIAGKGNSAYLTKSTAANSKNFADNFYDNFLKDGAYCQGCNNWQCPEGCKVPYWLEINTLTLSGKQIQYTDLLGIQDFQQEKNFEDGGWLYKNNDGYVCLFPTTLTSNDADGLDNDYTAGFGTNSILSRTSHGL
ncbi:MAG: hypothetical protein ABIA37_00105, partial [Candidatus Woesearchaeota archaeon]